MRIVFIGTVEFSLKALKKLIQIESNVVGVCTKKQSKYNSDFSNLVPTCDKNNIPYNLVVDINSKENIDWIKSLNPDIIFCFGWSSLIKNELLSLPSKGIVGYHPTELPRNRGRHPIIWSLVLGLTQSASTFFLMAEGADDGDILSQQLFEIKYEDDAQSLYNKISQIALQQIEKFVPLLENNSYTLIKQDNSLSNIWRKRGKSDGYIDFRMDSYSIYNLVRALTKPYIGAHIVFNEEDIVIWKVEEVFIDGKHIEPGKVLESNNDYIVVKAGNNAIKIIEHEFKNLPNVGEYL